MPGFNTPRLTIRDWAADVADPARRGKLAKGLARILTPPVTRHLPQTMQPGTKADHMENWIVARQSESDVLLILNRSDDALVGLILVAPGLPQGDGQETHIGYFLGEAAWGQGYATEALAGLIDWLGNHKMGRLVAGVDPGNPASARVLEKLGFVRDVEKSTSETEMFSMSYGG